MSQINVYLHQANCTAEISAVKVRDEDGRGGRERRKSRGGRNHSLSLPPPPSPSPLRVARDNEERECSWTCYLRRDIVSTRLLEFFPGEPVRGNVFSRRGRALLAPELFRGSRGDKM